MKLLVAVTVAEYQEKLEQFFSDQKVPFYNQFEVNGVSKSEKPEHRVGNWFGQSKMPTNNIAFFTMVEDHQADNLFIDLMNCKKEMPNCNIHAYILNIEKGV
ncbi:hypothetical protein E9993_20435 [Labilibacter sediminis]|nr:hypothetical protein E9993_20435 [Labilibacter sediminis]